MDQPAVLADVPLHLARTTVVHQRDERVELVLIQRYTEAVHRRLVLVRQLLA